MERAGGPGLADRRSNIYEDDSDDGVGGDGGEVSEPLSPRILLSDFSDDGEAD